MILLDTNVLSELMRPQPDRAVAAWIGAQPAVSLHIAAVTQAEILSGIALLPKGDRQRRLLSAAEAMFAEEFSGRILPFDSGAARRYADIVALRRRRGRPISGFDAQIAAIALTHRAALATRDTADFVDCGVDVIDPWSS